MYFACSVTSFIEFFYLLLELVNKVPSHRVVEFEWHLKFFFSNFRIYSYMCNCLYVDHPGFLLGLENLEKWEGIFRSGNFEQTGKVRDNHTKYWKYQGNSDICYLLFLVIFK